MLSNPTIIDSTTHYQQYIDKAKESGMKAISFSEHGNVFSHINKKLATEKAGLKYVHSVEAYVTKGLDEKVRDNYHTVLVALNQQGVHELNYLMSDKVAFNRDDGHFYYNPRITYDELKSTSDNIAITTACFSENTDVITPNGIKNIKDVVSGDRVISHTGEICEVNYPTTRSYKGYMVDIKAQGMVDTLYATTNHKFLVEHNGSAVWKEVGALIKGDVLLSPINYKFNDINTLDLTACRNNNTKRKVIRRLKDYNIAVTSELLQLIGMYVAEGSFTYNRSGIRFTIGIMYQDRIDFIVENMRDIFGLEPYIKIKESNGVDIEYSSTEIYNVFSMWFRQGAKFKCVPNFIKELSPRMQMYFIKGLIMCDGSYRTRVNKNNSNWKSYELNFTTISKQLYYEVIDILKRNNINISTYIQPASIDKHGVNRQTAYYMYVTSKLAKYVGEFIFGDKEDFEVPFDILLKTQKPILLDGVTYMPHKVTKIETKYDELQVYCLNVKGNHSFVANNIAVHNCLGSILNSDDVELKKDFVKFMTKNRHRCFLEIQHHSVDDQIKYNQLLYKIHRATNIPLIAGTDTHNLDENYAKGRVALQLAKNIRFANEEGWDLNFKTYDELVDAYEDQDSLPREVYLQALENTNVLADMVEEYELDRSHKYPELYDNSEEEFLSRIYKGVIEKGINKKPNKYEYQKRIQEEYEVYKQLGAIDFMLFQDDMLQYAKQNDIQYGYGRGSVNGSLIAYILDVTRMDSIKYDLSFFRFLNPHRVSLCDIDVDYEPSRRQEVIDWMFEHPKIHAYGIVTFNTVATLGSIDELGRAFKIPLPEVKAIKESLNTPSEQAYRDKYPKVFELMPYIEGTVLSVGYHPSGYLASPFEIQEMTSTFTSGDYIVSQCNMKELDYINAVKVDILGLANIEIINKTCKLANIPFLTPDNIDDEDNKVWDNITKSGIGIFQFEAPQAHSYLAKLLSEDVFNKITQEISDAKRIDLLAAMNGVIRPSGDPVREDFVNGEVMDNHIKEVDDFFADTLGFCIYQEQIMKFLNTFCGYSEAESDIVRRAIGKKGDTESLIPEIRQRFIDYMHEHYEYSDEDLEIAINIFTDVIKASKDYSFSKNHSFPYSYTGYNAAYLRTYYPLEFITAELIMNEGNSDKTSRVVEYMNAFTDITIRDLEFGHSRDEYFPDKKNNAIYKGFRSIKGMNKTESQGLELLYNREYNSFVDVLVDIVTETRTNTGQAATLIKLDFFQKFGKGKKLLTIWDNFYNGKGVLYKLTHVDKTKAKRLELLYEIEKNTPDEDFTIVEKMQSQLEYLGYINTTIPNLSSDIAVVTKVEINPWGTPFATLYRLNNGEIETLKVDKSAFAESKLKEFDIIKTVSIDTKHKVRKIDDKWVRLDEKEDILTQYARVVI